jgi:hypothetical protein
VSATAIYVGGFGRWDVLNAHGVASRINRIAFHDEGLRNNESLLPPLAGPTRMPTSGSLTPPAPPA